MKYKFRGKSLHSGEWSYGGIRYFSDGSICIEHVDEKFSFQSTHSVLVHPETVGLYTGIKDSNGIEIFEGDIVDIYGYGKSEVRFGIFRPRVKNLYKPGNTNFFFDVDGFFYHTSHNGYDYPTYFFNKDHNIYVICNIHEKKSNDNVEKIDKHLGFDSQSEASKFGNYYMDNKFCLLGRIKKFESPRTFYLDKEIELESGKNYELFFLSDKREINTKNILRKNIDKDEKVSKIYLTEDFLSEVSIDSVFIVNPIKINTNTVLKKVEEAEKDLQSIHKKIESLKKLLRGV